jgi:predicted RNA-binding protein
LEDVLVVKVTREGVWWDIEGAMRGRIKLEDRKKKQKPDLL